MAKDNVPFHTVVFPATLLGTKEPYTLLDSINATGKVDFTFLYMYLWCATELLHHKTGILVLCIKKIYEGSYNMCSTALLVPL